MIYTFGERVLETLGDHFIAPSADVIGSVRLGHEASVWFNAVLRGDNDWIVIGEGTNVQDGTVIHTDAGFPTHVGRNVTIGHAALLHNCTIGDDTLIGNRAVILDNVTIGSRCVIAAGALITPNTKIPDDSVVMGAPGKVVRATAEKDLDRIRHGGEHYRKRVREYQVALGIDPRSRKA